MDCKEEKNIVYGNTPCAGCGGDECFGQTSYSGCVEYNGPDIPQLGVTSGMSINQIIERLVLNAPNQSQESTKVSAKSISVPVSLTSARYNSCVNNISADQQEVTFSVQGNSIVLRYNINVLRPAEYHISTVRVDAIKTGNSNVNGPVFSSNLLQDAINLSASDFPLTLSARVQVETPCGPVLIEGRTYIASQSAPVTFRLEPISYGNSSTEEVSLEEKLLNLETQIQNLHTLLRNI